MYSKERLDNNDCGERSSACSVAAEVARAFRRHAGDGFGCRRRRAPNRPKRSIYYV